MVGVDGRSGRTRAMTSVGQRGLEIGGSGRVERRTEDHVQCSEMRKNGWVASTRVSPPRSGQLPYADHRLAAWRSVGRSPAACTATEQKDAKSQDGVRIERLV